LPWRRWFREWVNERDVLHAAGIPKHLARQGDFPNSWGRCIRNIARLTFRVLVYAALVFILRLVGTFNGWLRRRFRDCRCTWRDAPGAADFAEEEDGKAEFLLPGLLSFAGLGSVLGGGLQLGWEKRIFA